MGWKRTKNSENYNTVHINIDSYTHWDNDGNFICHDCKNRIPAFKNSWLKSRCKIDKKMVNYRTKCRHNLNINKKDIENSIKKVDELLEEYLKEHPEERFDWDKFEKGYNFLEQKYVDISEEYPDYW